MTGLLPIFNTQFVKPDPKLPFLNLSSLTPNSHSWMKHGQGNRPSNHQKQDERLMAG
jgi:hypothetical protein